MLFITPFQPFSHSDVHFAALFRPFRAAADATPLIAIAISITPPRFQLSPIRHLAFDSCRHFRHAAAIFRLLAEFHEMK
jgi:hypothetical protein